LYLLLKAATDENVQIQCQQQHLLRAAPIRVRQAIIQCRHDSGHASKPEHKEVIDKIALTKIIPIHSNNPELFEEMFKGKIVLPKNSEAIEI
jgi:mRNA degradation ribonuclease J1/J2